MTTTSYDLTFPKVTKLKGSADYPSWKTAIKYSLMSAGLWDLVEGGDVEHPPKPDVSSQPIMAGGSIPGTTMPSLAPQTSDWTARNNKATAIIILTVSLEITVVIDDMKTAKEMWDHLARLYLPHGFNLKYVLFNNLYACRLDQFSSADVYALKYRTLLREIAASGLVIDETLKVITFLSNIGSSYPQWVTVKRSGARNVVPSLDDLIAKLIDKERLEGGNEKLALMGKKGNYKDKKGKGDKKKVAGKGKGKGGKCTHCKKAVHSEDNCWKLHPEKMPEDIRKKQEAKEKEREKSSNSEDKRYNEESVALTAVEGHSLVANKMSWIADSGATQHMCCDRSAFSSIEMFDSGPPIRGVSGVTHTQGVGTVDLRLKNGGDKARNITLTDIYLMPDMGLNLFSIGTAETKGIIN